jgi:5'-nucleotidase
MNRISDPWTRRAFIGAGVAWLGAGVAGARGDRRVRTVSIIHTTDLHGHIRSTRTYNGIVGVGGLARCATCIRRWREENPNSLLVDIGDVFQGTKVGRDTDGQVMIRLFNMLGYDGWVIGNHDFDWGREVLEKAIAKSKMPVLSANLEVDGKPIEPGALSGAWANATPWMVREVGGFKIGLFGLTTPGLPAWLPPELLGGVEAVDPVEAAKRSVAALKAQKVDAIVALGHMGWKFQDDFANPVREIIRQVKGIDVFLAGHTHQDQPAWRLHGTLCSEADHYGNHCGRVDLAFDVESGRLADKRAFTVLMDDRFAEDPAVLAEAGEDLRAADKEMRRRIATVRERIPGKGRGSELALLFCKAFAWALKKEGDPVDGVFHGTFGTGDVEPGPVTVGDLWTWLPYENRLVVAEVSAADLAEIVAEDAGIKRSDRILWPFEIRIDPQGKVERILFKGEDVPRDRRFRIAFNAYDAQSGGRRMLQLAQILADPAAKRKCTPLDSRSAMIDYLREHPELP